MRWAHPDVMPGTGYNFCCIIGAKHALARKQVSALKKRKQQKTFLSYGVLKKVKCDTISDVQHPEDVVVLEIYHLTSSKTSTTAQLVDTVNASEPLLQPKLLTQ